MMADAFVEIRLLGGEGRAKQSSDLADAFHNVGREMYGWGSWSVTAFRSMLEHYVTKYRAADRLGGRDYVAILDETFESHGGDGDD